MRSEPGRLPTTKELFSWISALWRWLWLARLVGLTGVVLVAALLVVAVLRSEPGFRWTGLGLQLVGLGTVAWNIRGTRTQFGRPGLVSITIRWVRQLPRMRPPPIVGTMRATTADATSRATGYLWYGVPDGSVTEAKIELLEKNLTLLRDSFHGFQQQSEQNLKRQTMALDQETQARAADSVAIREEIASVQLAGLHVSLVGLVWLLVGLCMSTTSIELARWFGHR